VACVPLKKILKPLKECSPILLVNPINSLSQCRREELFGRAARQLHHCRADIDESERIIPGYDDPDRALLKQDAVAELRLAKGLQFMLQRVDLLLVDAAIP